MNNTEQTPLLVKRDLKHTILTDGLGMEKIDLTKQASIFLDGMAKSEEYTQKLKSEIKYILDPYLCDDLIYIINTYVNYNSIIWYSYENIIWSNIEKTSNYKFRMHFEHPVSELLFK